jgi:hypothetical protein
MSMKKCITSEKTVGFKPYYSLRPLQFIHANIGEANCCSYGGKMQTKKYERKWNFIRKDGTPYNKGIERLN